MTMLRPGSLGSIQTAGSSASALPPASSSWTAGVSVSAATETGAWPCAGAPATSISEAARAVRAEALTILLGREVGRRDGTRRACSRPHADMNSRWRRTPAPWPTSLRARSVGRFSSWPARIPGRSGPGCRPPSRDQCAQCVGPERRAVRPVARRRHAQVQRGESFAEAAELPGGFLGRSPPGASGCLEPADSFEQGLHGLSSGRFEALADLRCGGGPLREGDLEERGVGQCPGPEPRYAGGDQVRRGIPDVGSAATLAASRANPRTPRPATRASLEPRLV